MPRVCAALLWLLHALSAPPAAAFSSRGPTATRLVPSYAGPGGKYLQRGGPSPSDEDRFSDDEDWEMKGSGILSQEHMWKTDVRPWPLPIAYEGL